MSSLISTKTMVLPLGVLLAVVLSLIANKSAGAAEPAVTPAKIEILNAQPLALTVDSDYKAAATLFVRNNEADPVALSFDAVVKDFDDNRITDASVIVKDTNSNTANIPAFEMGKSSAEIVRLEIVMRSSPPAEGYLIVATPAGADKKFLSSIALKLRKPISSPISNLVVFGALLAAALVVFYCVAQLRKAKQDLSAEMGLPAWSFTNSWATNLTVASGVLNTALAITVLPEQTYYINKSAYTSLNILFMGVIGLAPVVYNFTRKIVVIANASPDGSGFEYRGRVIWFMVASAITLWAVLGQLAMQTLTLLELYKANLIFASVFGLLLIALAAIVFLLIKYAINTISKTATTQTIKEVKARQKSAAAAADPSSVQAEPQPRWALL